MAGLGVLIGVLMAAGGVLAGSPLSPVYAEPDDAAKDNICQTDANGAQVNPDPTKPCIPDPNKLQSTSDAAAKTCDGGDCSGLIEKYVNPLIKGLSAIFGVAAAVSLAVGGTQYSSAGGDPSKVAAARKRIANTILAVLAYLFMLAFLQWLIPGGII